MIFRAFRHCEQHDFKTNILNWSDLLCIFFKATYTFGYTRIIYDIHLYVRADISAPTEQVAYITFDVGAGVLDVT